MSDRAARDVAIVIVTYESQGLIEPLAAGLGGFDVTHEIVVVDNASSDGTLAAVALELPAARIVTNDENVGFGAACNQGAAITASRHLLFLNPDVVVPPGAIEALISSLDAHPDVGIVFARTVPPGVQPHVRPQGLRDTATGPGAVMLVRRETFEALEGFDPALFLYWEDTDLCWRAWLQGWRVTALDGVQVVHTKGGAGGGPGWDAEQISNGIYVAVKVLPWTGAVRVLGRLAMKTAVRFAQTRRPSLLTAWGRGLRRLPDALGQRRRLAPSRRRHGRQLAQLARRHDRQQLRRRLERLREASQGGQPGTS